jgi:hypothetical protein
MKEWKVAGLLHAAQVLQVAELTEQTWGHARVVQKPTQNAQKRAHQFSSVIK